MPSISKDQQVLCKLAQLSQALHARKPVEQIFEILTQIDDVNFKVLCNKAHKSYLMGGTLLHLTCYHKHDKAFEALLERGADFTAKNKNGDTALHQAFCDMMPRCFENLDTEGTLENAMIKMVLDAHLQSANTENPRSTEGLSHFHIACASNHLRAVHLFLNSGVSVDESINVNSSIFAGYTSLHFAIRFCSYETAKLLLTRRANVNAKDAKGLTPLNLIVERNWRLIQLRSGKGSKELKQLNEYMEENEKIIRLLLEDDRVLKVDETGFSKLHAACTLSDSSLAESFMKNVDINCAIHMDSPIWPGYTALNFAVHFNIVTFKSLLRMGADIKAEDFYGVTVFGICTEKYVMGDLYNILSATPTFKKISFTDGKTKLSDFVNALRSLPKLKAFFQSTPTDVHLPNDCPLWPQYYLSHLAVLFSKTDPSYKRFPKVVNFCVTETCLDFGGNALFQDTLGRTPLHLAFYRRKENIVDLFFRRQHGLVDVVNNSGLSHLHIACRRGDENAVRTLLSTGADVHRVYKGKTLTSRLIRGSTPLHIAVANEKFNIEIIKMLLEHGADANVIDADGMTPMLRFSHLPPYFTSNPKAIKKVGDMLFSSCKLKNIICAENGLSHLHVASFTGNKRAVEGLLKLGADPNAVFTCKKNSKLPHCGMFCFSGYTPMHFAVENKDTKVIQLLLQGGADILHRKSDGMTILYDTLSRDEDIFRVNNVDIHTTKIFASMLANDAALRKRAEEDCGLTLLHIACFLRDIDRIRSLLNDPRVDVNAQMHSNSPIWPGVTSLHLLIEPDHDINDLENTMRMLLDSGANVTLKDNEGDTPLHKTWIINEKDDFDCHHLLHLLLRYQTDFSVNPVNIEGISHFHLACAVSEHRIVEKFLEHGVDVNLPIDYHRYAITFQTPLQFMLQIRELLTIDVESHLRTMTILLKYGADIKVRDEYGSNPFLEVAKFGSSRIMPFLQKLYKSGVDIDCTNMNGQTAFEILLNASDDITIEDLQIFLDSDKLFNSFNSVNGIGIISNIIEKQQRKSILEAIIKIPSLFTVDKIGRTPVHNIVSNYISAISTIEYADYIERFIKMGFNVDAQDTKGETALHLAAHFHNEKAICGLLIAGADINVTDLSNQGVLGKLSKFRARWCSTFIITNEANRRLKNMVAQHIITMKQCGLEVNSENLTLANKELFGREVQRHREKIFKELEDTKLVKIGTGSLTLRDFLSETGAVASRPSMTYADREAVDKFFESIDNKRFPELSYLFKLQYRKMLKRLALMEEAIDSLKEILGSVDGFPLPEICSPMIIRYLTNTEVKHLIASTSMKISYVK